MIVVMKRPRKHDPGAYQCGKGGRERVDDQTKRSQSGGGGVPALAPKM